MLDICNNENPPKGVAEAKFEGEGAGTVGHDCSVVHSLEYIKLPCRILHAVSEGRGYETNFCTSVYKETGTMCHSLTRSKLANMRWLLQLVVALT